MKNLQFETNEADTIKAIITFLEMSGFHVWRNNTYGLYDVKKQAFRRLQYQQKGVADIIGFRKSDAKFIAIEVKIGKDFLKTEQISFLDTLKKAEGLVFIAHSFDDFHEKFKRKIL